MDEPTEWLLRKPVRRRAFAKKQEKYREALKQARLEESSYLLEHMNEYESCTSDDYPKKRTIWDQQTKELQMKKFRGLRNRTPLFHFIENEQFVFVRRVIARRPELASSKRKIQYLERKELSLSVELSPVEFAVRRSKPVAFSIMFKNPLCKVVRFRPAL